MEIADFETPSVRMQRMICLTFQAPSEDVDRIMAAVTTIVPLAMGAYDSNAFQGAPGVERYRPCEGAAAGAETELRRRPGTVEISFDLPDDQSLAARVVEEIFQAHSYQEPVIRLASVWTSRSKGLDDRDNPNRWWNTTGDWMRKTGGASED